MTMSLNMIMNMIMIMIMNMNMNMIMSGVSFYFVAFRCIPLYFVPFRCTIGLRLAPTGSPKFAQSLVGAFQSIARSAPPVGDG